MKIERAYAPASQHTFTIKPIRKLLDEELGMYEEEGVWEGTIDPFCGFNSRALHKNDINSDCRYGNPYVYDMDALDFLRTFSVSGRMSNIILDPPYSSRQLAEHYHKVGRSWDGKFPRWQRQIRDEVTRILRIGGKVISFGWNSVGIGETRGFEKTRILLVCHGGSHNDTIVVVEKKVKEYRRILEAA